MTAKTIRQATHQTISQTTYQTIRQAKKHTKARTVMNYIDTSCPYCGAPVIMDKKGRGLCEYCGHWVIYDNCSDDYELEDDHNSKRYTFGDAYNAGYEFEKGRRAAQIESGVHGLRGESEARYAQTNVCCQSQRAQAAAAPARRRHWVWWVLGWIFMYPVPLTILMVRNRSLPWWGKALITAIGWALYFLIVFTYRSS